MFYYSTSDFTIRIKTMWERQELRFRSSEAAEAYTHILRACGLVEIKRSGDSL